MLTGFQFDDFYDEVIDRVGGQQSTAEDVIRVRRSVRIVLERWNAQDFNTWRIRSTLIMATGASRWVDLPECVDDVLHVLFQGGGEVIRFDPARYMKISDKDRAGPPSGYFLSREEPPKLFLHPTGTGETLEVWHVERPEDYSIVTSGTDNVPGRWLEALISAVAHDVACKRPATGGKYDEALISRLDAQRERAEDIAKRGSRDRSRYRYRIA